jgi:hypothetical protein
VILVDTHARVWYASEDAQLSNQPKGELVGQTLCVHPVSCCYVLSQRSTETERRNIQRIRHALERSA